MERTALSLMSAALLTTVISCGFSYQGDGNFVDRGPFAANNRYVLDLGRVQQGTSEYDIGRLPKKEFVIGLQISGLTAEQAQAETADTTEPIEIRLTDDSNATVLYQSGAFQDWTWTCGVDSCTNAFAYLRKEKNSGTYLIPNSHQTYSLFLKVPESFIFTSYEVRIIAISGGWK